MSRSPIRRRLALVALSALAFSLAPAHAEAQSTAPPDARAAPPAKGTLAEADASLARMDDARSAVRRRLQTARTARDVVRVGCLNDKLNQTDVTIRAARARRAVIASAASPASAEEASRALVELQLLRQRAAELATEADQCMGVGPFTAPGTSVTFTVDPGLPAEDALAPRPIVDVVADVPPCTSCVK